MRTTLWLLGVLALTSLTLRPSAHTPPRPSQIAQLPNGRVEFWNDPPCARVFRGNRLAFTSPGRASSYSLQRTHVTGYAGEVLVLLGSCDCTYPRGDLSILDAETLKPLVAQADLSFPRVADDLGLGSCQVSFTDRGVGPFKGYPRLLFRVSPGGLSLALDLMARRPTPNRAELRQWVAEARWPTSPLNYPYPEVLRFQELVYSGRADLAREYLARSWPPRRPGREAYQRILLENLQRSSYWSQIHQRQQAAPRDSRTQKACSAG